jgi:hypothetical protein
VLNYDNNFIERVRSVLPDFPKSPVGLLKITKVDRGRLREIFNTDILSALPLGVAYSLVRNDKVDLPNCGHCGTKLDRVDKRYCGKDCYKADPAGWDKISQIKTKLYSDPKWKVQTENKKKATCLENNGVEFPMQSAEIFQKHEKSSFQSYDHKGMKVRGYESYIVDYFQNKGLEPNIHIFSGTSIMTDRNLRFKGFAGNYQFPDLYIKPFNCFVEVKGDYTLEKDIGKISEMPELAKEVNMKYYVLNVNASRKIPKITMHSAKTGIQIPNFFESIRHIYFTDHQIESGDHEKVLSDIQIEEIDSSIKYNVFGDVCSVTTHRCGNDFYLIQGKAVCW